MQELDKKQFVKAMKKEAQDQFENGNFTVMHKSKLPKGATVLPAVWQMKRKRDTKTQRAKKHKARLNIDGSRMKKGIHCDEACAPVASWNFLGINVDRKKDGATNLTQPHPIDQILKDLRLEDENVTAKDTPASSSKMLRHHADSEPFDGSFNHRSVIGKLNHLEKGSRSDVS
jgi:hypothetical protein